MRNELVISKILGYITKISNYCNNVTYSDFISLHSSIPWKQIRGLRNRIVHDYEGVNLNLVWEIISDDLPELQMQLETINN